jgi:hypothetical protein
MLNKVQNFHFIQFCLDLVQNLDFLYFGKYNIFSEKEKDQIEDEIKSKIFLLKFYFTYLINSMRTSKIIVD